MRPDPIMKDKFPLLHARLNGEGMAYILTESRIFDALVYAGNTTEARVIRLLGPGTLPFVANYKSRTKGEVKGAYGYAQHGSPVIKIRNFICRKAERALRKDPSARMPKVFEHTLLHELTHWLHFDYDPAYPKSIIHRDGWGVRNSAEAGWLFEYRAYGTHQLLSRHLRGHR